MNRFIPYNTKNDFIFGTANTIWGDSKHKLMGTNIIGYTFLYLGLVLRENKLVRYANAPKVNIKE